MKYNYSATKEAQIRTNTFAYFNRPNFGLLRRFGGPLIIVSWALILAFMSRSFIERAVSIFFIVFGIYYTLRPYVLIRRMKFEDIAGTMEITDSTFTIINRIGQLNISKKDILRVFVKRNCLFLRTFIDSKRYYVFALDSLGDEADSFVREMMALAKGKN